MRCQERCLGFGFACPPVDDSLGIGIPDAENTRRKSVLGRGWDEIVGKPSLLDLSLRCI